jgi:hypothetical protein
MANTKSPKREGKGKLKGGRKGEEKRREPA